MENATLEAIKGRGNFTWTLEKKPYQIKFDSSTTVLGMPKAKTWILLANHADASLMRNKIAYDLAAEFGLPGSPDSRFVDLTVNGEYLGNYLLTEKVEVKTNRLELQDPRRNLLELDNNYGLVEDITSPPPAASRCSSSRTRSAASMYPSPHRSLRRYDDIQTYLEEFESYLYASDPDWSEISARIDVESFIKYYFVFEIAENPEITQSSVYFWRDGPSDVLHAGPVWDFDSGFASYTTEASRRRSGSGLRQERAVPPPARQRLVHSALPQRGVRGPRRTTCSRRSSSRRSTQSSAKIDGYSAGLAQSAAANFTRWPNVLGKPSVFSLGGRTSSPTRGTGRCPTSATGWPSAWRTSSSAYGSGMPVFQYAAHVASDRLAERR